MVETCAIPNQKLEEPSCDLPHRFLLSATGLAVSQMGAASSVPEKGKMTQS